MAALDTDTPSAVRRLETPVATALADLAAVFEDLQTVLRCCERLMSELATQSAERPEVAELDDDAAGPDAPDDLALEAFWTTALLSYTRCFTGEHPGGSLTEDDVVATGLAGDVRGWHQMLLRLRAHQADPARNPREVFAVGVSQNDDGTAAGIAVTSTRQPLVDDLMVRQTGAIAYALSGLVDERIGTQQAAVAKATGSMDRSQLDALPVVALA
jgi:hypothetical protein